MDTSNPALVKGRVDSPVPTTAAPIKEVAPEIGDTGKKIDVDMYITYSLDHDVPFVADYYGIGNMMNYKDLSYKSEVDTIDNYLVQEVKAKRLDNSTSAVKIRLKQLEKIAGIDPIIPTATRVKKLAAYAEYLQKLGDIDQAVVF